MTRTPPRRDNRGSPMLFVALAWSLAQVPEPPAPVDDVVWVAPSGCPDRSALISGVERRRGRPLAPGQVRVDATITAGPANQFTLDISLTTRAREDRRTLTADRCAALVDAAALLIAVAIDEQDTPVPIGPPAEPPIPAEPAPDPVVAEPTPAPNIAESELATPPPPTPAAKPPQPRLGAFVRFQGGLALGTVPGPTGVAALALGLLWKRARLELQPLFAAPRTTTQAGHQLEASLYVAAISGCYRAVRGAVEVPLCGGFEAGLMRGVATGPDGQRGALGGWLAVLAGTGVVWRVHRNVGLWLGVQGTGVLRRPKFLLSGAAGEVELYRALPVTLRVLAGLELRFGDPR